MNKLAREDLWSLEAYAEERPEFRRRVIEHKKLRQISLGAHVTLAFEDALTIKYQVQEMLRVERIFERSGIEEELEAYNPLIPDGTNWKATMMIEYPDVAERREALARMAGIEHQVWARVGGGDKTTAIANEDLDRSNEEKTAAVHFLRFELTSDQIDQLREGASLEFGIDHPELPYTTVVEGEYRAELLADLD